MHLQMDVLNNSLGARDLKTTAYTPLKQGIADTGPAFLIKISHN